VPIYEYECESCHNRFEVIQRFSDKPLKKCQCGGPLHKVLSPPALHFKGTGWYVTDYGRGSQQANGNGKHSSTGKSEPAKSETTVKSETKTDTKKE
jgi:putative FmdB family regulatory protein